MLASMCRITVILDFRSPLTACGVTYGHDVDGRVQGIAIPKHHNSRGPFIESVLRKGASWPSNALEDEAQIIGGRIRTAISPAGNRRPRPPAAQVKVARRKCVAPGGLQSRHRKGAEFRRVAVFPKRCT